MPEIMTNVVATWTDQVGVLLECTCIQDGQAIEDAHCPAVEMEFHVREPRSRR